MTWPTKKLSELLETCDAGTWGKPAPEGKGLFVLRSTNITNGGSIDFTDVAELDIRDKVENLKLLNGDILLEKSGGGPDQPVGRVVYFMTPSSRVYTFANFIQRLRANSKFIDSHFLFYRLFFLHKIGFTKKLQSQTTGIRNLKMSLYLKTEIPIPPLAIQKQIVERLDKIAEAQKLNDELIQKTDELFQSLLYKELNPAGKNWEAQKLENLLELCDAGVWGKATRSGGMMVLRSTNFKNGGVLDFSNVPELKIDEKKRTKAKLKDGDILLEKSGGGPGQPVGRVVYFTAPDQMVYTFANFIQRLRPNLNLVNSNFLFYHLLRLYSVGYTKKLQSQTTGIRNLKLSLYLRTEIPLPPLVTQKQIVTKLSAVQEYKGRLLEQKAKLKELFESALHNAFRGSPR